MEDMLHNLVSTWWGILILCALTAIIWISLSVLLYKPFFKRFYDVVLSAVALLILSPVLLVLTIVGAIKMRGNPFFTQQRPGKNGKIFRLIKFRTMTNACDEKGELLSDDARLTRYGKLLRSTSLDELPELFNIFVGNMSIVGPRPLLVEYLPYYTAEELHRHDVRPGLTGLAQVNGRNMICWDKRLKLDNEYVRCLSMKLDIKILFLTLYKIVKHSDIAENTNEAEGNFAQIREMQFKEEDKIRNGEK